MLEYRMPSLGADMESGFLREWRVKPGDKISKGDIIADVETQKGIIEIEVFADGIIGELLVSEDEKVPVGTLMATIIPAGEETSPHKEKQSLAALVSDAKEKAESTRPSAGFPPKEHHIRASPLAKRIAAEKGIDISTVHGSGPEGAITREDVEQALIARMAPAAEKATAEPDSKVQEAVTATQAAPEPIREKPDVGFSADSIRMAVAAAMSKANREIPHYYLETRVDMSRALGFLAEINKQRPPKGRLLPAVLQIKAVAKALMDVPDMNASWENGLQRKNNINIGYVVALRSGGILVPTFHDADSKSLDELMESLNELIPRARALRLRSSELADSTITLSSLGEGGVEHMLGIIYPPQVAMLGFGGISEQPWAEKGMLGVRPVMHISLAADHRASDGSTGSKFLNAIKSYLQEPETL